MRSKTDPCPLPIWVQPGVSVILFPVSGKAAARRDPHPDGSTAPWDSIIHGKGKGLGIHEPNSSGFCS